MVIDWMMRSQQFPPRAVLDTGGDPTVQCAHCALVLENEKSTLLDSCRVSRGRVTIVDEDNSSGGLDKLLLLFPVSRKFQRIKLKRNS